MIIKFCLFGGGMICGILGTLAFLWWLVHG